MNDDPTELAERALVTDLTNSYPTYEITFRVGDTTYTYTRSGMSRKAAVLAATNALKFQYGFKEVPKPEKVEEIK